MDLHPYLFCLSFYLLSFVLPPFDDNGLPFWVPDVLCQHSEVVLWNLLGIQMFFWWICGGESGLPVLFLHYLRTASCLFIFYAEYIMWNPRLVEAQGRIEIAGRNINNLTFADDTTLLAESKEKLKNLLMKVKLKNLLMKVKERGWKICLKTQQTQQTKIMASSPITLWQIDGWGNGNSDRLYFLGLQNHCGWWLQPWN